MVKWLNHVTIAAPRNGTTSHTVDPSSASNVVAGAAFTPTAGNFLVCFSGGSVTSTTPSGWTLPTGGNVVAGGGLYVWYRTAAGGDTITTTHNGSNYPVVFDIYEFPASTTFIALAGQGNVPATGNAGPSLSGLTASSNFRCAVVNQNISAATTPSFTWSNGTEAVDTGTPNASGTDGYGYSLSYMEDQTGATYSSTATSTVTNSACERLVFALNVPASANSGTLSAALPRMTSTLSGSATNSGTASAALPHASTSLSGTSANPGTTGASAPLLTASLSGTAADPGSISASVPRVTSSMTGEALNSGSLNASAPLVVTSIEEEAASNAVLDAVVPRASWSSAGESRNSGSLDASLPLTSGIAQGSQTNSGTMMVSTFLLDIDVAGASSDSGNLESGVPLLETAIEGSMVNSGSLDVSVHLVEPGLFGDSIVTGSLDAQLAVLRFFIEDLGGRRDVEVLSVAEVPTNVVTVAEIARSVVIQEVP